MKHKSSQDADDIYSDPPSKKSVSAPILKDIEEMQLKKQREIERLKSQQRIVNQTLESANRHNDVFFVNELHKKEKNSLLNKLSSIKLLMNMIIHDLRNPTMS